MFIYVFISLVPAQNMVQSGLTIAFAVRMKGSTDEQINRQEISSRSKLIFNWFKMTQSLKIFNNTVFQQYPGHLFSINRRYTLSELQDKLNVFRDSGIAMWKWVVKPCVSNEQFLCSTSGILWMPPHPTYEISWWNCFIHVKNQNDQKWHKAIQVLLKWNQ